MCRAYTDAFKRCGWSDRLPFSAIDQEVLPHIDLDRGRHEIPLVDVRSGEVLYGLEAMTTVLAKAMPRLRPILKSQWLMKVLKPLYWLITYNRRIIAGTPAPAEGFDCAPDFHRGWRLAWMGIAGIIMLLVGIPGMLTPVIYLGVGILLLALTDNQFDAAGHYSTAGLMATLFSAPCSPALAILVFWVVILFESWRRILKYRDWKPATSTKKTF
jgi:hypothetical protein